MDENVQVEQATTGKHRKNILPYILFILIIIVLVIIYFVVIVPGGKKDSDDDLSLEERYRILQEVSDAADPITFSREEKQQIMESTAQESDTLTPSEKLEIINSLNTDE